jgi:putative membrane protein
MLFNHAGRAFGHHTWWWLFGGILPLLLFLVLMGLGFWLLMRATARPWATVAAAAAPVKPDLALEEVRLRYARGEVSREEFVQRTRDLGGSIPEGNEPGPPGGSGPA